MGELLASVFSPGFWVGAGQIIGINLILSGDNAVVIALACRMLPPRQRFWGMILGAGVAVLLAGGAAALLGWLGVKRLQDL